MVAFCTRCGVVVLAGAVFLGCASTGGAPETAARPAGPPLPMPGFADNWRADGEIRTFAGRDLFEHINGEGDLYYPYGFVQVWTVNYANTADAGGSIQADVYEMGSKLDAFGVYSNYRYPDSEPVGLGVEGFIGSSSLLFCQGAYFVRLNASGPPEVIQPALRACAGAIAERLPPDTARPAALARIDVTGVEMRSARYIAESLLGYDFFPRGLVADAALPGGAECRVFSVLVDSGEAARAAYDAYLAYVRGKGNAAEERALPDGGVEALCVDPLYKGALVRLRDGRLGGVIGLSEPEAGMAILDKLLPE